MKIEIHITTAALGLSEIDDFVNFCKTIDAKPIIIELADGEILQHPMISKRVEVKDRHELDKIMSNLKSQFTASGYHLSRIKLEVHSKSAEAGKLFFPDFKGGYYEWHAKVYNDDLEAIYKVADFVNVHVSKNGLKGIKNRRILTVRETRDERLFLERTSLVKKNFASNGLEVVNEEHEYCIYDSNKSLDKGWINTPEITDQAYLDLLSFEAFLRRAAKLDLPFMLKGSLLTRQLYAKKEDRIVRDLDFLYFGEVKDDVNFMESELSDWVEAVTSTSLADGVAFKRFSENKF